MTAEADTPTEEKQDTAKWSVSAKLEKYDGDVTQEQVNDPDYEPVETVEGDGNILTIGGVSAIWERLIRASVIAFDNGNARIGVGDSTTAAADTQTNLQAATNKLFKAQDTGYPQHSDSTSVVGAKTITYRSTFSTAEANFAWQEWGIDNNNGRFLNRKVESFGTKTSSGTWVLTVTISLA